MSEEKDENEQGFNDAELQDIMNEIESLEREFSEDEEAEQVETTAPEETETVIDEAERPEEAEILSLTSEGRSAEVIDNTTRSSRSAASMDFHGSGQLDFQMSFQLGSETADLVVSQENGLIVKMNGVDLTISEEGCTVSMDGGVTFSVPFGQGKSGQKAA